MIRTKGENASGLEKKNVSNEPGVKIKFSQKTKNSQGDDIKLEQMHKMLLNTTKT